ncbi:hypothetical protein YC2023_059620 [Brassica napus]
MTSGLLNFLSLMHSLSRLASQIILAARYFWTLRLWGRNDLSSSLISWLITRTLLLLLLRPGTLQNRYITPAMLFISSTGS